MYKITTPDRKFYQRKTALVARELIGHELVRRITINNSEYDLSGRIVETEAYGSMQEDEASHAFSRLTKRNSPMFGPVGRAYVYFTYGNHFCVNVTAKADNKKAGAVLIRSIEPLTGIGLMQSFRQRSELRELTSGPGRLSQALAITMEMNALDMTDPCSELYIQTGKGCATCACTPRIGITKATNKLWRFVDPTSKFLSRPISKSFARLE